jgi:hypothetical protein
VKGKRLAGVLRQLHLPTLRELADELLEGDATPDRIEEVTEDVAAAIDALVDWSRVLPVPAGIVVELVDRPLYCRPIARMVVRMALRKA